MRLRLALPLLVLALFGLSACLPDRDGPAAGAMQDPTTGTWVSMNPENMARIDAYGLGRSVAEELGLGEPLAPVFRGRPYYHFDAEFPVWYYDGVGVDLVVPEAAMVAQAEAHLTQWLKRRVSRVRLVGPVSVTVGEVLPAPVPRQPPTASDAGPVQAGGAGSSREPVHTDAAAPVATTGAGAQAGAGSGLRDDVHPSTTQRHYTIQAGDTLAEISSVFYGTPNAWRRIVEANPGLDPAALPVGSTIRIP